MSRERGRFYTSMLGAFIAGALAVVAFRRRPAPSEHSSVRPSLPIPVTHPVAVPPPNVPPADGGGLKPIEDLTKGSLISRSVEIFPSAYATLLSIVQGIALGLLITQFTKTIEGKEGVDRLAVISESVASFACVVVIYYMYVWFLIVVRWAPTVLDTLIPFGLGVAQIGAVLSIPRHNYWIMWIAGVQLAGTIAYLHSFLRSRSDMFSDCDFKAIRRLLMSLLLLTASGFLLALALGLYVFVDSYRADWVGLNLGGIVTATGICLTAISERTLSALYRRHGLRWLRSARQ